MPVNSLSELSPTPRRILWSSSLLRPRSRDNANIHRMAQAKTGADHHLQSRTRRRAGDHRPVFVGNAARHRYPGARSFRTCFKGSSSSRGHQARSAARSVPEVPTLIESFFFGRRVPRAHSGAIVAAGRTPPESWRAHTPRHQRQSSARTRCSDVLKRSAFQSNIGTRRIFAFIATRMARVDRGCRSRIDESIGAAGRDEDGSQLLNSRPRPDPGQLTE